MQSENKHFQVAEVSTERAKQSVFHAISPGTGGKLLGFKCEAFADCAAPFRELVPATSSRGGAPLIHACLRNSSKIDTDQERALSAPFSSGNRREIENFPCVRKVLTSPPARVSAKERKRVRDF